MHSLLYRGTSSVEMERLRKEASDSHEEAEKLRVKLLDMETQAKERDDQITLLQGTSNSLFHTCFHGNILLLVCSCTRTILSCNYESKVVDCCY